MPKPPVNDRLLEHFRSELGREIGPEQGELLEELLRHTCNRTPNLSLDAVILGLIDSHHCLSGLMAGLLRCQVRHLETLLPEVARQPANRQVDQLKAFFDHYGGMQESWISLAERTYQNRIEELGRQVAEGRDLLLEEQAKNEWLSSGQIRLFNYFCELMVLGVARLESLDGRNVIIWMTPKLERVFAAGDRMRFAHCATGEPNRTLLMEIIDTQDDLLTLRIRGVAPHPQGRRKHMRVSVNDETAVTLGTAQGSHSGWVLDFSESGLGVSLDGAMELAAGDDVTVSGTLRAFNHKAELKAAKASVRWTQGNGEQTRIGLRLQPDPEIAQALQEVLLSYEQAIIQRLRELGTPEMLL